MTSAQHTPTILHDMKKKCSFPFLQKCWAKIDKRMPKSPFRYLYHHDDVIKLNSTTFLQAELTLALYINILYTMVAVLEKK